MTDSNPSTENPSTPAEATPSDGHVAVDEVLERPLHDADPEGEAEPMPEGSVSEPAKVMRIGSMIRQLLEEVRSTDMDEPGRSRLREIYDTSIAELSTALSPDLQRELVTLGLPFGDDELPTEAELRIAQAQLVGWLEGLFHGIQATLFAQQMEAKQQLAAMSQSRNPSLPRHAGEGADQQGPGVYL
ncbi:MAG: proteasome activator [Acidimicrobiales bacterium]